MTTANIVILLSAVLLAAMLIFGFLALFGWLMSDVFHAATHPTDERSER